jgi:SAM-dependent methyltransferase
MADSASEPRTNDARTMYQHPLAYLLGLQGIALLRAFGGVYDREFTLARFAEIRELIESPDAFGSGIEARPISTREGYDSWAPSYDEQLNQLLEIEQPIVREILDGLPIGVAVDAACGTGRHAAYLASLGHGAYAVRSVVGGGASQQLRSEAQHAGRAERPTVPGRGDVFAREVMELDRPPVGRDDAGVLVEGEPVGLDRYELDLRVRRLDRRVVEAVFVRPDVDVPAVLDDEFLRSFRGLDLHACAEA